MCFVRLLDGKEKEDSDIICLSSEVKLIFKKGVAYKERILIALIAIIIILYAVFRKKD